MNSNFKLITEVNRINNLIRYKLINEAFLSDDVVSKFIRYFESTPKFVNKIAQELGITGEKLSEDISKITNKDEFASFLNSRISGSPTLKQMSLTFLMDNLNDVARNGLISMEKELINAIKQDKTLRLSELEKMSDDFVDDVIKTDYKIVSDEIKNNLKATLRDEFSNIRGGKVSPNAGVTKAIKVVGSGWFDSLKACGLTKYELITVTKVLPLRKLRALQGSFLKSLTTINKELEVKALESAFGNVKLWAEKLENNGVYDNSLLLNANNILLSLKTNKLQSIDVFRTEVINAIRRAEGPNGEKVSYATIDKIEKGLKANIPTDPNNPSWIRDIMLDYTPLVIQRITKMDKMTFDSRFFDLVDTIISIITFGTLRIIDEMCRLFNKLGPKRAFLKAYSIAQLMTKVLGPLIYGFFIFIVDLLISYPGITPPMPLWERFKKDIFIPLKNSLEKANLVWLMNPFDWHWDEVKDIIITIGEAMSQGEGKFILDKFKEFIGDTEKKVNDELVKRGYPPITDTTTTIPSTDTTGTSTPPQTSGLPEAFNSFTPYATFEKIDDNKYKMKFKSDLPPDFSDLKNYETTAEKSGDKWIWYYTDGTSMEF